MAVAALTAACSKHCPAIDFPSTSFFEHLPVHLQSTVLAYGGAAFNTCQASASVPLDTRCLALWLRASKQHPLASAAKHKLWDVCSYLLSAHGYQPGPCEHRSTLCFVAAAGKLDLTRQLLDLSPPGNIHQLDTGSDVNSVQPQEDPSQASPLVAAARHGHAAICTLLLDHGWGREQQVLDTSILAAAEQGHLGAVEVLLGAGAEVSAPGRLRTSPLAVAARRGHLQVVKALVDAAQPVAVRRFMCAVLAAREGHTAVMDLLTSNMDVNGHRGMLLSSAAGHGEAGTVQHLIKRGADVNAEAGKALYLASSYGHETTVRVLLHHGADPNLGAHNNALGAAARGHHASICAMLIRSGAAVQTTDHAQLLLAAARDCKDQELHTLLAERGITSLPTGPSDRT